MKPRLFAQLAAGLVLSSSLLGCMVGLRSFQAEDARTPQRLAVAAQDAADRLDVDATVVSVDAAHGVLRLQLAFHPRGSLLRTGGRELAEDLEVTTNAAQGPRTLKLPHGHVAHGAELTLDLTEGDIAWYPLDGYRAQLELEARGADDRPVPLRVDFLSRQHAMHVEAALDPASRADALELQLTLSRPGVSQGFAGFMHLLMLAVGVSAFIVAYGIGFRNKKPEGPLLVWMSALLFVLPAFRGMLPGNPPLGVLSDYLVFFWVEGLVASCLLVVVLAWSRRGTAG